jgi:hypothetical protein
LVTTSRALWGGLAGKPGLDEDGTLRDAAARRGRDDGNAPAAADSMMRVSMTCRSRLRVSTWSVVDEFGGQLSKQLFTPMDSDIESLERRNDASIAALESKTSLLRGITAGIHGEVRQQNDLLVVLMRGILGVLVGLGGTVVKIKRVVEGPRGAQYVYGMVGGVVLLVTFWKYVL